jgi:hypothetical protein
VPYDPQLLGGNSWVPYVSAWAGETIDRSAHRIVERPDGGGIGYADETIVDRDEYGVLWQRTINRIGVGRPLFGKTHAARQRRAMRRLLCQVCARPADRDERGVLWLINDHRDDWPGWPENLCTVFPPLCLRCVRASVRVCPAMRADPLAVRVRHCPITGVLGHRYRPGVFGPQAVGVHLVDHTDPGIGWVVAGQQVRTLYEVTIVDLDNLT